MFKKSKIDDKTIRLIFIPFFGIVIPNLTGLFGSITYDRPMYWIGYIYFILISYTIWHGNRYFLFKQREHYDWFANPVRKLVVLVFANIFYTAPVTVLMLLFWYYFAKFEGADWQVIELVTLMNVIAVIFITHVYETVFLIKERESDLIRFEKLERAKTQAELDALKSQIDPHFLFNSLNTLSHLIKTSSRQALEFNDNLADVYRYILMNKDRELIQLQEEIKFLKNYFTLLKLRFGKGIEFSLNGWQIPDNYLIPPITLQVLLENAVKHNRVEEKRPLKISLQVKNTKIVFMNDLRPKQSRKQTSQIGLKNLKERFKLVTNEDIVIKSDGTSFVVEVPLLRTGI